MGGYSYLSKPRVSPGDQRGGGLMIIYRNSIKVRSISLPNVFEAFEQMTIKVSLVTEATSLTLSVMYRPPNMSVSSFFDDFDVFL